MLNNPSFLPNDRPTDKLLRANSENEVNRKRKLLGKGAVVAGAGIVSNLSWYAAIGINRVLEKTGDSTLLPAVGYGAGITATEYIMASLATRGETDISWNPKKRIGKAAKAMLSKAPLVVSAWRGAASGAALDQIAGREVTPGRTLAHASTYGFFMGAWVSEPGSYTIGKVSDLAMELIERPTLGAAALGTILGAGVIATREPKQAVESTPSLVTTILPAADLPRSPQD
jgi:hypothetical protein